MTIKAIIIDDEPGNIQNLESLLAAHCPEVNVLAVANSATKGIEVITKYQPDLVFLDIEMPRGNGFDMLDRLQNITFEVVFVTAYNQYAIKAIRFCALDYLLKPINVEELKSSVERVRHKIEQRQENERMRIFMQHMQQPDKPRKIALPMASEVQFVEINQIIYCLGENNYTYFFLTDGKKFLVTKTLKEFEELLSEYGFVRVHRSYLINLSYVKAFIKKEGGYILMSNNDQVSISRSKRSEVLQMLSKM